MPNSIFESIYESRVNFAKVLFSSTASVKTSSPCAPPLAQKEDSY